MKKKMKKLMVFLLACVCLDLLICLTINRSYSGNVTLSYEITSAEAQDTSVYYSANKDWEDVNGTKVSVKAGQSQQVKAAISVHSNYILLQAGSCESDIRISNIKLSLYGQEIEVPLALFSDNIETSGISSIENDGNQIIVHSDSTNPYIIANISSLNIQVFANQGSNLYRMLMNLGICIVIDLITLIFIKKWENVSSLVIDIWSSRKLIGKLAYNDFKTKYAGSFFGIFWAFVQPIVTVLIYWLVFQMGFKSGGVAGYSYVLWLIAGIVPWFFFSEAWSSASYCMMEYSYLVKKVVFKINILPVVKVMSSIFVHIFFILLIVVVYALNGHYPDLYMLQVVYYSFCTFVLVLGLVYFCSAVVIFFKDLNQIIMIAIQVGIWAAPILWNISILPQKLRWIIRLNPVYYIVEGYRDCMINKVWFWQNKVGTLYFWVVTLIIFGIGVSVFKKLKVHFADVL